MLATVVAIVVVDRGGRRMLFFEGGVQMALAEICMAGLIAWNFRAGADVLSSGVRTHTSTMQYMLKADLSGLSVSNTAWTFSVGAGMAQLSMLCSAFQGGALPGIGQGIFSWLSLGLRI